MRRFGRMWIGTVPLLAIWIIANLVEDGRVESDLHRKADTVIHTKGHDESVSTRVAGRDVDLTGATDEGATITSFIESVGAIGGVRLVHSSLTVLPRSVPFSLSAKPEGDSTVLSGNIPSEALRGKLVGALSANGRKVIDHLIYRGAAPSSMGSTGSDFGAAAEAALAALARLGGGYVEIQGNQVTVGGDLRHAEDGKTIEKDLRASLPASFKVAPLYLKQPAVQAGSPPPASSPEPERSSPSSSSPLSTIAPYPFTLDIGKGTVHLSGDAPDEDARRAIGLAAASQFFDAKVKNDLTLAAGAPTGFSSAVINAIPALARLGRGSLTLSGNSASVQGDALYPNATKEIGLALEAAFGKGFTLKSEIGVASSPPLDPVVCQPSFDRLLDVGHINYATDSAVIPPEAAPLLDRLVDVAQRCRLAIVSVAGFTDATGTAEHNMDLSQRRAQSVVTYLIGAGVDKARISAIGYGEGGAVASNATPEGRAENRHIAFKVIK